MGRLRGFSGFFALVFLGLTVEAKYVQRSGVLGPNEARVESKFCYDYSLNPEKKPGLFQFKFRADINEMDEMYLMLFDDQWESFPQARAVWDQASCDEKLQTARWYARPYPQWMSGPDGFAMDVNVTEKMRARFWYAAVVNCNPKPIPYSYEFHMINPLRGWQSEFGFDELGTAVASIIFTALYVYVAFLYVNEYTKGAGGRQQLPGGAKMLLWLLGSAIILSSAASLLTLLHQLEFARDGWGFWIFRDSGKLLMLMGKGCLFILFSLFAKGECFSTEAAPLVGAPRAASLSTAASSIEADTFTSFTAPSSGSRGEGEGSVGGSYKPAESRSAMPGHVRLWVEWGEPFHRALVKVATMGDHHKILAATGIFVLACFMLELYGTYGYATHFAPTYVYDTIPGFCIITLDALYFVYYLDAVLRTHAREKHVKRKEFYGQWGSIFALWFLTLPFVAFAAFSVYPWYRMRVVTFLIHALNLGTFNALLYAFHPARIAALHGPPQKAQGKMVRGPHESGDLLLGV
uniref:GPR180/TMEM145 transmembrane domain-containing protein n=1 Tax=Chromera velia CCMP2878 TaxID=1169474 RepID=A0A0G4G253_9ALVE|mmetsp:Transcript_47528/g.93748  ORF Transcript_47528/g.93748 Transcript_47528/m.93748 type:complete len:520 (+) Transcript_47528:275-1834(+)|eukprot:Cvel_19886.t1-p1 / transcript=Cvel_19886.t1 / gene=Cvel_19886 / organism=Chromera_velia_CCMP2878 / gene_product=hypothetical protein / transcript_product=hypothetical protein / location=Cvel_scaffold1745:15900-21987(+) / protein_length=519 / sequence_SO=supercontig / SO=protein_coding / is_pseudo=false